MCIEYEKHVVLFDGECNLCNSSVDFIIRKDKKDAFRFASLQSDVGSGIAKKHFESGQQPDSIVLAHKEKVWIKSSAALEIAKHMPFPWPLFYVFKIIPTFLRNPLYDYVARNRYKWFGKRETCRFPTPEERAKILG